MKKNLILIDFLLLITKENKINDSIKYKIENDPNNDYILISEESISILKPFLEKIRVKGVYTDSGCIYYRLKDNQYILDYYVEKVGDVSSILYNEIYEYFLRLPYKIRKGSIIKGDYYYYFSFIGTEYPQNYTLYHLFPIELYQEELKLKIELLCFEHGLEYEFIKISTIGFYLIPKQYKKNQILSKLPYQDYSKILFLGDSNLHHKELIEDYRIQTFEIKNGKELKYFLETY